MLRDLINKFAPLPPEKDHTWDLFMIDLLTLGTLSTVAPFFNSALKKTAYFVNKADSSAFDNSKDTALTLVGQSTTIAKDLLSLGDKAYGWTPKKQDEFAAYFGNVIWGWVNATGFAVDAIFSGSDESLDILWNAMSGGKLIAGRLNTDDDDEDVGPGSSTTMDDSELRANILKSIFGMAIPELWYVRSQILFLVLLLTRL